MNLAAGLGVAMMSMLNLRAMHIAIAIQLTGAVFDALIFYMLGGQDGITWWPLALFFQVVVRTLFSVLFALVGNERVLPTAYAVGVNSVHAVIILVFTLMFYLVPVDWHAVNSGALALTKLQSFARDGSKYYLASGAVLVLHFLTVWFWRIGLKTFKHSL